LHPSTILSIGLIVILSITIYIIILILLKGIKMDEFKFIKSFLKI
jgi:hypothetical protein